MMRFKKWALIAALSGGMLLHGASCGLLGLGGSKGFIISAILNELIAG